MFPTVEARWFYRGQAPPEVEAWFHCGAGRVDRQPIREDYYLRLRHTAALGIKLREGRVEIKQRVLRQKVVRFHQHVTGVVEHWRKWSFPLAEASRARMTIAEPATSWIPVRKERVLRTYRLAADGCVVPASSPCKRSDTAYQGCDMELTAVHVLGQDWWTLAFEAFGKESRLQEQLLTVARHVFAVDEPPLLNVPASHGYARLLRRVAHEQETI